MQVTNIVSQMLVSKKPSCSFAMEKKSLSRLTRETHSSRRGGDKKKLPAFNGTWLGKVERVRARSGERLKIAL